MKISKDYDQISIDELKNIFEKRTSMSFSVLCARKDGITAMVPIGKADILFEPIKRCGCERIFDPAHTKFYIQRTLKKHFQGQNEFYKRTFENTGHGETLVEIRDWLNSKIKLFNGMTAEQKENYFMDLYNALTYDPKNYNANEKHNSLIVDVLFDLGVLMRVLASSSVSKEKPTIEEKLEHDRVSGVYERLTVQITASVLKYIRLNRRNKNFIGDILNNRLLKTSFTMSHGIRVFIMYADFMMYYNEVFNQGIVAKIRKGFEFYQRDYNRVFEKFDSKKTADRLEDVFKDSMQIVPYASIESYSLASYAHDIGKFYDFEYYMAGKGYDEKRIQKHLFASYYMLNGENHTLNTIFTAAFHHEYYGHGYGPYNTMYKAKREEQSYFYSKNIISYDIHDVLNHAAVGYFPAKMLEIVDVYDTILYPWFVEQEMQASTIEGVADIMRKSYIEDNVKLDPILVDIFFGYIEAQNKINLHLYKTWNIT